MSENSSSLPELSFEQKKALLLQLLQKQLGESRACPMSLAQEQLWLLDLIMPGTSLYNIPVAFSLKGSLDVAALEQAFNEITRRHEILRTTFDVIGTPVQIIHPNLHSPLPIIDLSNLAAFEKQAEITKLLVEEAGRHFDLNRGPLIRTLLIRLAENEHTVMMTMHRIIADGWSLGVLFHEIGNLYSAFAKGSHSTLPDLEIQYRDYAAWQRQQLQGDATDAHVSYWKKQLSNLPDELNLPFDRPRPLIPGYGGARHPLAMPESLTPLLADLSRAEGITLYMILLAAFSALLHLVTGQDDIVVGSPASTNRDRKETEMLIGLFGNFLPLRADVSGNPSFRDLLKRAQETTLGAYAHQDADLGKLLSELQHGEGFIPKMPFQVVFALAVYSLPSLEISGLDVELRGVDTGKSKFDLTLWVWESAGLLDGAIEYSTDLFDDSTIEKLARSYLKILETGAQNPQTHLDRFHLSEGLDAKTCMAFATN